MLGKEITEYGTFHDSSELTAVHVHRTEGEVIKTHSHPGKEVFFTIVKGEINVTLSQGATPDAEQEVHHLTPGTVLQFPGELYISGLAVQETEAFVYLINRR